MPLDPTFTPKKKKPAPKPGAGTSALGGTFTPQGFVPNKPKVPLPTDQAPYRHGQSPAQRQAASLRSTGEVTVVDNGPSHSDAQRAAHTMAIQRMLNARGANLAVDGQWGPRTEAAYQAYLHHTATFAQQSQKIDASRQIGYVDMSPHALHEQALLQQEAERRARLASQPKFTVPTKLSKTVRLAPHFEGEPVANYVGVIKNLDGTFVYRGKTYAADGSLVSNSGRPQPGARISQAPIYTDVYTHSQIGTRPQSAEEIQGELMGGPQFQAELQQANKLANPSVTGTLEGAAQMIPGVPTAKRLAAGESVTGGGVANEGINAVLWLGPNELAAPFRIAAGTIKAARTGEDVTAVARAAVQAWKDKRLAKIQNPIIRRNLESSPERDQFIAALDASPGINGTEKHALLAVADHNAVQRSVATGEKPSEAWGRANFGSSTAHAVDASPEQAQALAQTTHFQQEPLTDQLHQRLWDNPDLIRVSPFYGKLYTLVSDMPPKVGVQEVLGKIKSAGIKQDEIKWSKFDKFLSGLTEQGQKSVSREEALAWLDNNYLQVEENRRMVPRDSGSYYDVGNEPNSDITKFGNYTIPGGQESNYQEFTIRLPEDQYGHMYSYTGHFPDANILAHVRTTDRLVGGGEGPLDHTLMIEEIQSDWHQAGQKQGYAMPVEEHPDYPMRKEALDQAVKDVDAITGRIRQAITDSVFLGHPELPNLPEALRGAFERGGETSLGINLTDSTSVQHFIDNANLIETELKIDPNARAVVEAVPPRYEGGEHGFKVTVGGQKIDGPWFQTHWEDAGYAERIANSVANNLDRYIDMRPADRQGLLSSMEAMKSAMRDLQEKRSLMQSLEMDAKRGVADAPFQKTWHELAFKRMLAEAVDKGYDRIAWTTGRTQAERYQLANFFDRIEIQPGSSYNDGSEALWDWADDMARDSVDNMNDEELGLDTYLEERLREEAMNNIDFPSEEEFYFVDTPNGPLKADPEEEGAYLDQSEYDYAYDAALEEVDTEYASLLDSWRDDARESMYEAERQYYMENADEYDNAPTTGSLVVNARKPDGTWATYNASEYGSGQDNALENVIGPDLAKQYSDNGQTQFEGTDLMAGENTKSALGAAHFYDNKLTGFVNKYLKKTGVQTTKEQIGSVTGPFRYRLMLSPRGGNYDHWVLEGRGDYPYSNFFDAINAQHRDFGDIPKATITHENPEQPGTNYSSVWVKWSEFPKDAKPFTGDPHSTAAHGQHYEGWGGVVWGPFDNEQDAAVQVEDLLIRKDREWASSPGAGTVVHSIPITDEVRSFVDQGQALFQRDPLMKDIKKAQGYHEGIGQAFEADLEQRAGGDRRAAPRPGEPDRRHVRPLHEHMGEILEQRGQRVKGAVTLGDRALHLFERADASTVIHELGHVIQQDVPLLSRMNKEAFARSFEQYFREGKAPLAKLQPAFDQIAAGMKETYGETAIPGARLTPHMRGLFDKFFTTVEERHPEVAQRLLFQAAGEPRQSPEAQGYKISDEQNGTAETLWHTGARTTVGKTETLMGTGGAPAFHLHVHDPEGNLVAAQHGFLNPDDGTLYASSVYVHPNHEGKGISSALHGLVMDKAEELGRQATAIFKNRELGARTMEQARARGRLVREDPETGLTYFQTEDIPPDESLANTSEPLAAGTPVEQLRRGLKGARQRYGMQKSARSEELKRRAEEVQKALASIEDPDEAAAAARAALKGELPKIDFQGLTTLDAGALRALKIHVKNHPTLLPFQKLNINEALDRAVKEGRVPAPHEMRLIESVFGKQTARGIAAMAAKSWGDIVINALNIPRSLMATADLSAATRQSLVAMTSHPLIWGRSWPTMLKSMKSGDFYDKAMEAIKSDPLYNLALAARVSFTDVGEHSALIAHEEAFASDYAAKIPGVGHVIKGSARAYTGFLNKIRMDLFKNQVRIAMKAGVDVHNEKWLKDIGDVVNAATGRGTIHGRAEHILPAMNTIFFSPRLMLSRLNYLDPTWYVRLSPQARREALRGLFATAGAVTSALYMFSQIPGVDIGSLDPRSADFGKLRVGNTRIDVAGGFQQYVRLAAELATGYKVSSTTGRKEHLGHGYGVPTKLDEVINFFLNKSAPAVSIASGVLRGKDPVGNPVTPQSIAWNNFTPLLLQDANDIAKEHGGLKSDSGLAWAIGGYGLGAVGVGLQTYKAPPVGKKQTDQLTKDAKSAGLPEPPKSVLIDLTHKAELDSLSQAHKGDVKARAKSYIDYYAETTGDHSFDRYKKMPLSNSDAEEIVTAIRGLMVGPGLSEYEKAIRDWKKTQ